MPAPDSERAVLEIRSAPPMHWVGDGFPVRTLFSYAESPDLISPFLLLDYACPREFPPSDVPRGVGEHPHRGFETVTIAYAGEIEHRDSSGAGGRIGPGDVQWMTAASGVVHEEMHGKEFARRGGSLEMVQLWVNLPAKSKMTPPRYQDLQASEIPSVAIPGRGSARVIAGTLLGTTGPAKTFTPVDLWDLRLEAGAEIALDPPAGRTVALLVRRGRVGLSGGAEAGIGELALFDPTGGRVVVTTNDAAEILVMSGEPIREPVVGYGPFVMNSEAEIRQAMVDYSRGKMGHLA